MVDHQPRHGQVYQPFRGALAVALVYQIVIPRTHDHRCAAADIRKTLLHYGSLHVGLNVRSELHEITGDDHQIVCGGVADQPVELAQVIVQIGDDEDLHREEPKIR